MLYTGKGVTVAILDTGISTHIDFGNRIVGFADFVNNRGLPYDDSGHGTHVAGILGGSGLASGGKNAGVAPECNIVSLKILDKRGLGESDTLVKAFRWLERYTHSYGIRVVNISVGGLEHREERQKRINHCVEKLWDMGLTVVAAAGNMGPEPGSITAPGSSCKVITVGSSDMLYAKKHASSRGPVGKCPFKPDIVTPGTEILSCAGERGYQMKSGTSMSTPRVAGAIALLLEKEPDLTNSEIKKRLCQSSDNLNLDRNLQGCGRLNIKKLLQDETSLPEG